MALFGLLDEVEDSIATAEHLLASNFSHRATPHARIAYEAAQQALILVTEERYEIAGARVVIFFRKKDRDLMRRSRTDCDATPTTSADASYEDHLRNFRKLWELEWPDAGPLFDEARQAVESLHSKPANWFGGDPAKVLEGRYAILARALGHVAPAGVTKSTADAFSALSRGSHPSPEFPELVLKSKTGELAFQPLKRDRRASTNAIVAGLTAAAGEAMLAATYRASAT